MVSWFALLDSAKTPAEVLGVARDFMATWTPEELGRLPEACRPGKLRDANDIETLHACLVEEYRRSRATGPALKSLQELTSFFVRSAIRIAEITDPRISGGSGGSPSGPSKSASPPEG